MTKAKHPTSRAERRRLNEKRKIQTKTKLSLKGVSQSHSVWKTIDGDKEEDSNGGLPRSHVRSNSESEPLVRITVYD